MEHIYSIGESISIGISGESNARECKIDITPLLKRWPNGRPTLWILRPGDKEPYPVATKLANNILTWQITSTDVEKSGYGQWEIQMTNSNTKLLGKSKIGELRCANGLIEGTGEIPEAKQNWLEQILGAADRAEDAADRVNSVANGVIPIATIESTGVVKIGGGLDVKEDGTLSVVFEESVKPDEIDSFIENYLTQNPPEGKPGFSPTVTVQKVSDGIYLHIEDINGKSSTPIPYGKDYVLTEQDKKEITDILVNKENTFTEETTFNAGIILTSPNGTQYQVIVNDDGTLVTRGV